MEEGVVGEGVDGGERWGKDGADVCLVETEGEGTVELKSKECGCWRSWKVENKGGCHGSGVEGILQ